MEEVSHEIGRLVFWDGSTTRADVKSRRWTRSYAKTHPAAQQQGLAHASQHGEGRPHDHLRQPVLGRATRPFGSVRMYELWLELKPPARAFPDWAMAMLMTK